MNAKTSWYLDVVEKLHLVNFGHGIVRVATFRFRLNSLYFPGVHDKFLCVFFST